MTNLYHEFLQMRNQIETFIRESMGTDAYYKICRMYDLHGDTLDGCKEILKAIDGIR